MRTRFSIRALVVIFFAVLLVVFGSSVSSVLAAPEAPELVTSQLVRETVNWSATPATCPEIDKTITGVGQRFQVTTTTTQANGAMRVWINDFVKGTATDTGGGTYVFIYSNQNRLQIPPVSGPIKVNMTDTFLLSGNSGVNNLNVGFAWQWTYTPPDPEWPPKDNWVEEITIDDPLKCDPI